MRRLLRLILIAVFLLPASACLPQFSMDHGDWRAADLRWLGKADAPSPATNLLAIYTHTTALSVDIRMDLLDLNPGDSLALKVSLWDNRSFSAEPLQIELGADGSLKTTSQAKNPAKIWPRLIRDDDLDTITISLNRFLIGSRYHLDVATYLPGEAAPADEASRIYSDGLPPPERAPFLLAFWNAFPADTPAQALRGWDGAHTGPLGGRYGLKYLLEAARTDHMPLTLLDLKKPASLAALNYLEALGLVDYLSDQGLLLLPEAAYSTPADMALTFSRRAAAGFGLPANAFVYDPLGTLQPGYAAQFVPLADPAHLSASGKTRLIPLPPTTVEEATEDGPALEVRQALVNVLLSADPADLVVLGGSLPDSTWGQADMVAPTFAWLDGHPWIQRLDAAGLLAFPLGTSKGSISPTALAATQDAGLLQELRSVPANAAGDLAWQAYLRLYEPTLDPNLQALRKNYLGQVSALLAAARWAEHPAAEADCGEELIGGGQPACILSNESYFAVLDPAGARLTNLFYRDNGGVHQLVGPSSQFSVGLSDPSEWKPQAGLQADPAVLSGAFVDASETWAEYTPVLAGQGLAFTDPIGPRTKTYQLTQKGLRVDYDLSGAETVRIPLAVDPQAFYSGPVNYRPAMGAHSWTWGLMGGLNLEVSTDAALSAQGFVSSYPFLSMPEDPNLDYPGGHYLPFPLSLVRIQGEGSFTVSIQVK